MTDKLRTDLPNTASASTPAVLLPYQQRWVADDSQLKVGEKSRRIGLTWAEASDNALIAAADKKAGGQNVYYIGYNQDMAIEYVEACAMWSRAFHYAASEIEEGIWEDGKEDKHIKTYTIRFPESGHRIVALSSRPANLRGKQGVVVIDEAAFHDQLKELLKAALALLIWGGRVRILSTHNGDQNPFNELIQEIRAGKRRGSVFHCTFRQAVEEGLYERVCLRLGKQYTAEGEKKWVQEVYDFYGDHASEELDVIPSAGAGRYLSRALAESVMTKDYKLLRFSCKAEFAEWPEQLRKAEVHEWCQAALLPELEKLDPLCATYFGEDFGRSGDTTLIKVGQQQPNLDLYVPFAVDLRNVPFEQQKQILFYLVDRLPRFQAGALDATGNGAYLAEVAKQRYGGTRISEVKLNAEWYRLHMPRVKAAFEDRSIMLPKHEDVLSDLLLLVMLNGVARIPDNARVRGSDGFDRHGEAAIALAMLLYAVAEMEPVSIEFESTGVRRQAASAFEEGPRGPRFGDDGFGIVRGGNDFGGF